MSRRTFRPLVAALIVLLASCSGGSNPDTFIDAAPNDGVVPDDGRPPLDATDGAVGDVTLTVTASGSGTGVVRSSPAGVDCGATCTHTFPAGSVVALIATPDTGSGFTGWSGPCTGIGTCVFTINGDTTLDAAFDAATYPITMVLTGNGTGSVTSAPAGIDCPGGCTTTAAYDASFTFTAVPAAGSTFVGWSGGGCVGTGPCTVVVHGPITVNAAFVVDQTLVVTRTGFGTGTVTSTPAGIDCGTDCTEIYPANSFVTLTAVADAASTFAGWTGGGCVGTGPCTVNVNNSLMVAAQFDPRQFTLLVARAGTGTGVVTSLPAGINCGADCSQPYTAGTMVTLVATPTGLSTFAGWSGGGCTGTGNCVVTVSAATNVTATFSINSYPLTVVKSGTGMGQVVSDPTGIDCGADCNETYLATTMVRLTASPAAGSAFSGWSGGGCTGAATTCVVTITAATTVTASFAVAPYTLTVVRTGPGTGTVTSSPAGINCGATCAANYGGGTIVTLSATAGAGSVFTGWTGGGCSGTGVCMVTMTMAVTVSADFDRSSFALNLTRAGTGSGTVTSSPTGINCGADCTEVFIAGTPVVLTAVADPTSTFAGWSGGGCTGTGTCTTTINAVTNVTATFNVTTYPVTITKAGNGTGTVTSAPGGINCGATCTASFAHNTTITLNAAPTANSTFTGWSGGGCTGTAPCMTTITAATAVTATFTLNSYPINVTLAGTSTGTVSSNPPGIDCGTDCTEPYLATSVVVLTATPAANTTFAGWTGGCTGTGACTITIGSAAVNVTATFNTTSYPVTITKAGNGGGTVTSAPAGINCGATCTASFAHGTTITLNAAPVANSSFAGWTGGGCTGTGPCMTTITAATAVTATFTLNSYPINVTLAGNSTGTVSSNPPGIDCGTDCTEPYLATSVVVLTATPAANTTFAGWTGACTGTGTCTITIGSAAANVTATFNTTTYVLTVAKAGNGTGTVTSSPGTINCGSTCTNTYAFNTAVTLNAAPAATSTFAGWSGGGCTGTGPCTTTITAATTVTATFTLNSYPLNVTLAGNSTGTVSSNPAGIDCGTDCTETYQTNTVVVLTAVPAANTTFAGWTGACTGTSTCTVTIDASNDVTATFNTTTYVLTIAKAGNGTGTVTSSPGTINCGSTCTNTYAFGTMVTLNSSPAANSTFAGWSGGGCTGTAPCVTTISGATTVTATYTLNSYPLNVTLAGTGTGTVSSNPAGIDCGTDCTEVYQAQTTISLTAVAGPNSVFTSWSGACTGSGACNVTIGSAAASVTATFTLVTNTLTVTKAGNGAGTVTSSPGTINCGTTCSNAFAFGTVVTLTAAPAATSSFTGWTGGGCSGTGTCITTVTAATTVTATFVLNSYPMTVTKNGTGTGTVSSSPAGIDCGLDCNETYLAGTVVALTPVATASSTFTGWAGACTGTGACNVTIDATNDVTATFTLKVHRLTVTKNGTGTGTVTSSPVGVNCGADCFEDYNYGTLVTLSAAPAVGSNFAGWTGAGCSGTGTCVVTIDQVQNVTATFNLNTFSLTVNLAGAGAATSSVSSSPPGITCGADCTEVYNTGQVITLTATPSGTFGGWTGVAGCSTALMCVVTLTANTTVTATFN